MADNSRKTPMVASLNNAAMQRAADAMQQVGKALPCEVVSRQGQLVTVKFLVQGPFTIPNVTIPVASSKYDWVPLQVGDRGLAVPSDVYLGGVSGQGGGTARFPARANLSTLQFIPAASTDFMPPGGDTDMRVVQGPNGVLVQTVDGKTVIKVTKTKIMITVQSGQIVEAGAGGTLQFVKLADGSNSTVLKVQ